MIELRFDGEETPGPAPETPEATPEVGTPE